jgi:hypothetical protein
VYHPRMNDKLKALLKFKIDTTQAPKRSTIVLDKTDGIAIKITPENLDTVLTNPFYKAMKTACKEVHHCEITTNDSTILIKGSALKLKVVCAYLSVVCETLLNLDVLAINNVEADLDKELDEEKKRTEIALETKNRLAAIRQTFHHKYIWSTAVPSCAHDPRFQEKDAFLEFLLRKL